MTRTQPIPRVVVHGTPGHFFLAFDRLNMTNQYLDATSPNDKRNDKRDRPRPIARDRHDHKDSAHLAQILLAPRHLPLQTSQQRSLLLSVCKHSVHVRLVKRDAWIKERDRPVRGELRGYLRGCDLPRVFAREQGRRDSVSLRESSPCQELKPALRPRSRCRQHAQCQTGGA